ncbi:unnamed protein product, partial [Dicrocoelium dendriticum]
MSLPRRNGKEASNLHSNRLQIASTDNMTKCHALPKRLQVNRNNTTLGVVSSKQLDHVRTFIAQPSQNDSLTSASALDDGKNTASTLEPREYHLSQEDEKIINAVMLKVAELNVDKLPDSSLVKVLTSIYL